MKNIDDMSISELQELTERNLARAELHSMIAIVLAIFSLVIAVIDGICR